jgi:hypothetical protein
LLIVEHRFAPGIPIGAREGKHASIPSIPREGKVGIFRVVAVEEV